jgi:hypothetical protein
LESPENEMFESRVSLDVGLKSTLPKEITIQVDFDRQKGRPTEPQTETPDPGQETPDPGLGTPDPGQETPEPGQGTPDPGQETPDPAFHVDSGIPEEHHDDNGADSSGTRSAVGRGMGIFKQKIIMIERIHYWQVPQSGRP